MIRLYASNETDFTHNAYPLKNIISCEVQQIENGAYACTIDYTMDNNIQEEAVLKVPTPSGEQLFVITKITKTLKGFKAYAIDYISYKLRKNFLTDVRPTNLSCENALKYVLNNLEIPVPFTASSDVGGIGTAYYIRKNGLEALIGAENSILNNYGGYLIRDGMNIHIAMEPRDIGYEVRLGYNLLGIEQDIDINDVVTRIYPTAVTANDTVIALPEKYVDSPLAGSYAQYHIKELRINLTDEEKALSTAQIQSIMRQRAAQEFSNGVDLPKVHYKVDFIQLAKDSRILSNNNTGLARYTHDELSEFTHNELALSIHGVSIGDPSDVIAKMNELDISHMVSVYVPKLGIYVRARVIKYVYDGLGKKFKSIELGDYRPMERYMTNNIILNMDRNLKLKANQTSIDTPTHKLTENGFVLKDKDGGVLVDKNGSVNNDNFSSRGNVESGYPLWIPFEVDTDVSEIKKVSLWWKNFPYRASAKSISGGGGVVKSTGGGGGAVKSTGGGGGAVVTTPSGGGSTSGPSSKSTADNDGPIAFVSNTQTELSYPNEGKHYHRITAEQMAHSHGMAHTHNVPDHKHTFTLADHIHELTLEDHIHEINIEDHIHPIEFGIVETPITDDTIEIVVDGTVRTTVNARQGKVDLTPWVTTTGDHEIELRSSTKKLIHANVALKTFIKGA
ncbi:phage tail spike protein [Proteiniclasticum sp.]|uniref:phage tail spike protein n=1 Tax=Proteiniclasticum sp. TaxID=2053595 RepID=UPI00289E3C89|nr:phage tail spike protein [Proteiniclasticum sp.]